MGSFDDLQKVPGKIRIDFKPEASAEQKKAAFAIRDSFDYRRKGLADFDQQLDRLLLEAVRRESLDEVSFGSIYLRVQRAKLSKSPEAKRRFILETEKMMNSTAGAKLDANRR